MEYGKARKAIVITSPDTEFPQSGKFMVRYTPGEDGRSRRLGRPSWLWITVFFGSLLFVGIAGYLVGSESYDTDRPKDKR